MDDKLKKKHVGYCLRESTNVALCPRDRAGRGPRKGVAWSCDMADNGPCKGCGWCAWGAVGQGAVGMVEIRGGAIVGRGSGHVKVEQCWGWAAPGWGGRWGSA